MWSHFATGSGGAFKIANCDHKRQATVVFIARYKSRRSWAARASKDGVCCPGQAEISGSEDIVAEFAECALVESVVGGVSSQLVKPPFAAMHRTGVLVGKMGALWQCPVCAAQDSPLVADLDRVGFVLVPGGKGSHRKFRHPKFAGAVILSGHDGDDAKHYQEKQVRNAIRDMTK